MTTRIRIGAALAFAALAFGRAALAASAEEYPDHKIVFLVGFPPGGAIDLGARHIADALSAQTKQAVIIENKPGAGGIVAADTVAHARPDGYTLFYSPIDTLASASYLYKTVNFDPMADFVPVATTAELPFVLQVNPKTPIKSVADLSAFLTTKKGDATFAAPNAMAQIASDLYKSIAGVGAFKVPYKSIQTAQTDLMAGDIDFLFIASSLAIGPARDGKLRSLAVTSAKRSGGMPELPTMVEAGVPGYELSTWSALWAPRGTPPEVIKKLSGTINAFLATDASRAYLRDKLVADTYISSPEALAEMLKQQHARWAELVKIANIEPQ
jgi:tripartite-type tricarboxylate transporter receptor subunit TctC